MARIGSAGMADYTPPAPLPKGWYNADVLAVKDYIPEEGSNRSRSVIFELLVEDPSGENPMGIAISDFIPLEGYASMRDGGDFVKAKFYDAVTSAGGEFDSEGLFDPDDVVNNKVEVRLQVRDNPSSGKTENSIVAYRPYRG